MQRINLTRFLRVGICCILGTLVATALLLAPVAGVRGQEPTVSNTPVLTVPFTTSSRTPIIPIRVDESRVLRCILDTGMVEGVFLLDPQLGKELELEYVTTTPMTGTGPGSKTGGIALGSTIHFGDLEHFEHQGRRFLFIPITGPDGGPCRAMAVFDPDTLDYIDHACIHSASWVALDPAGLLYVCDGAALYRYEVDWELLAGGTLRLGSETRIPVRDENGRSLNWTVQQGGAFSSDGELLYIATGYPDAPAGPDGIHVFSTTTWRRVRKSSDGHCAQARRASAKRAIG